MICLALECSTSRRSVAIARDGVPLAEAAHATGRDTPLFGLIADVLARAAIAPADLQCLAVGLGPGSYTGIRIAIAAAQGWALAHPVHLLGIDSVTVTAHRARLLGHRGHTAVVADAHRGECYVAEYDLAPDSLHPVSALRIASKSQVDALRNAGAHVVGPDLEALGIPGETVFPDASVLAQLAHHRTEFVAAEDLHPIYLRSTTFVKAPPPRAFPIADS